MNILDLEVRIFKAIAHPTRLSIIKQLSENKLCVCELSEEANFTQSNMSQHLRILKDASIVNVEKEGNKMMYSVKNKKILDIIKLSENIVKDDLKEILISLEEN